MAIVAALEVYFFSFEYRYFKDQGRLTSCREKPTDIFGGSWLGSWMNCSTYYIPTYFLKHLQYLNIALITTLE